MNRNAKIAIGVAAVVGLLFITRRANAATPQSSLLPSTFAEPSLTTSGLTAPNVLGMSNATTGVLPAKITPTSTGPSSVLPDLQKLVASVFAASPTPSPTSFDAAPSPIYSPAPTVQTVAAIAAPAPTPAPMPSAGSVLHIAALADSPVTYTTPAGITWSAPAGRGIDVLTNGAAYMSGLSLDMPGG